MSLTGIVCDRGEVGRDKAGSFLARQWRGRGGRLQQRSRKAGLQQGNKAGSVLKRQGLGRGGRQVREVGSVQEKQGCGRGGRLAATRRGIHY